MIMKSIVCVVLCLSLSIAAQSAEQDDYFVRDLGRITQWFEGEFDNEEQLWFHTRSGSTEEAPTRLHIVNKRVELPSFGDIVFYTEEYADNDPQNIVRQRLVTFSTDTEENAIRMRQGFFKNAGKIRGGNNLGNLKADDVFFMDECDVFFRRVANHLRGSMKSKTCVFGEGSEKRYSQHDIILSTDKFWRVDATFLVSDDSFFKGTPPDRPTELRRAKIFSCDYYFYGKSSEAFPEGSDLQVVENIRVHSQGGIGTAIRKRDGRVFELLIREKEYPSHPVRSDFIYYSLRYKGETTSIVYGVADRASRQFGTSSGEIGGFCHREGYSFDEKFD